MLLFEEKTQIIIKCFYKVNNVLGYGFLEKVYENALAKELSVQGLHCEQQSPVKVFYEGFEVGLYYADIIVDNKIIVELKTGKGDIVSQHELQLMNYLKATNYEVGLILYFSEKPTLKRKVLTNNMK